MVSHNQHPSPPPPAHRHLAFAVVRQAIADVTDPAAPVAARQSARRFLAGDDMYRFWVKVATGARRQSGK